MRFGYLVFISLIDELLPIGYNDCNRNLKSNQLLIHMLGKQIISIGENDMNIETRRFIEKQDDYGSFSVSFYGKSMAIGKHTLPLGQMSVEFLEMTDEQLLQLRFATQNLLKACHLPRIDGQKKV